MLEINKPMIRKFSDLENIAPERIKSFTVQTRKDLEDIIKKKLTFEKQYQEAFNKRYWELRGASSLWSISSTFWFNSWFKSALYELFLINFKEKFIDDFISIEIKRMNDEFIDAVLTGGTGSFSDALQNYKTRIASIQNPENFEILHIHLNAESATKLIEKEFSGRRLKINEFKQEEFDNLMVLNMIYSDRENTNFNWYLLYNPTERTGSFFIAPNFTLNDLQLIGFYRDILKREYEIETFTFNIFENLKEFQHYKKIIDSYVQDSIRAIREIQDDALRVWFLNSIHDEKCWDFSLQILKERGIYKAETQYGTWNNGYKTIFWVQPTDMWIICNNLSQVFWIPIEWKVVEWKFVLGRLDYRIEITSTASFNISIRRLNNKLYTLEEIQRNGIETNWLLWKETERKDAYGEKINLRYPIWNRDYDKESAIAMLTKRWEVYKEWMKLPWIFTLDSYMEDEEERKAVMNELLKSRWVSLVSWGTGSWKTTLLKTILQELYRIKLKIGLNYKIIFLESPVEEELLNFYQVEFDDADSDSILEIIKATKRMNPQFSMVWESRDAKTWETVLDLSSNSATATTSHELDIKEFLPKFLWYVSTFKNIDINMALDKINLLFFMKRESFVDLNKLFSSWTNWYKTGIIKFMPKTKIKEFLSHCFWVEDTKKDIPSSRIDALLRLTPETANTIHPEIHPIDWEKSFVNEQDEYSNSQNKTTFENDYLKTGFLYERMFSTEVKQFKKSFINPDIWILLTEDIKRIQANSTRAYKFIGWKNTMIYKKLKYFLQGRYTDKDFETVKIDLIKELREMKKEDRIDIFENLEKDFAVKSVPKSKSSTTQNK